MTSYELNPTNCGRKDGSPLRPGGGAVVSHGAPCSAPPTGGAAALARASRAKLLQGNRLAVFKRPRLPVATRFRLFLFSSRTSSERRQPRGGGIDPLKNRPVNANYNPRLPAA